MTSNLLYAQGIVKLLIVLSATPQTLVLQACATRLGSWSFILKVFIYIIYNPRSAQAAESGGMSKAETKQLSQS